MSRLIKEDDELLYLERYLHDETDNYSDWEMDSHYDMKYSQTVHEAEHYAFYEVKVKYTIRKSDGDVNIIGIA